MHEQTSESTTSEHAPAPSYGGSNASEGTGSQSGQGTSAAPNRPKPPAWAAQKTSIAKPNISAWAEFKNPGDAIDGVMAYHGEIFDQATGRPRRLFIVRDGVRELWHWGVSERANLVGLRRVPVGARVWIAFLGRRKTGQTLNGKEQEVMEFDVRAEHQLAKDIEPTRATASSSSSGTNISMPDPPPASDEDIPF